MWTSARRSPRRKIKWRSMWIVIRWSPPPMIGWSIVHVHWLIIPRAIGFFIMVLIIRTLVIVLLAKVLVMFIVIIFSPVGVQILCRIIDLFSVLAGTVIILSWAVWITLW